MSSFRVCIAWSTSQEYVHAHALIKADIHKTEGFNTAQ